MLTLFGWAFLLGLVFNAAPGAVFAETVRQWFRGGYRSALAVQIGSLAGDALWAVLGLLGVGLLLQVEWLTWPVGIAGVLYLLWLCWDSWVSAEEEFVVEHESGTQTKRALSAGMTLSITNPQNIAFWAALGSALGTLGVSEPQTSDYATFFCGFIVSSIAWSFICAWAVDCIFRTGSRRWARITYRLCAAAFLALAMASLRDLLSEQPYQEREEARSEVAAPP